ncbi:hypothetical protein [Pseudoteredinibacter isoporae]|uniref:hypothetical protein n=1 Tax=Pseudoteredinibacter isoporae TaxID=570281 RepID=UPI00310AF84B
MNPVQLEQSTYLSTDECPLAPETKPFLPALFLAHNPDIGFPAPQDKLISGWDGPALFTTLAAFGIFISLAFLSQPEFDTPNSHTTLSVSLNTPQAVSEPPVRKPEAETAKVEAAITPQSTNAPAPQADHPQPSQKTEATDQPPPSPAIDYSLIQSIINDDSGSESPLGTETEQNTGPHNTVFDNKFRQYLHSEELKEFNRRRESVDIGNYNDGTAEHFSDGNGHCFKVIDNAGETMWVRKNCLKKQKRELEFGRLKLN